MRARWCSQAREPAFVVLGRQPGRWGQTDAVGWSIMKESSAGRRFQDPLEGVLARDVTIWCDDRRTLAAETGAQQAGLAPTRAFGELADRSKSGVVQSTGQIGSAFAAGYRDFVGPGRVANCCPCGRRASWRRCGWCSRRRRSRQTTPKRCLRPAV